MVKMSNNDIEEKNEKLNIQEIFENARKDPTLFSTMNIEELLNSIENEKNDYLENSDRKI